MEVQRFMKMLDGKSIQDTLLCTQLVKFENGGLYSATAKTVE
jgi:hypothetical protein